MIVVTPHQVTRTEELRWFNNPYPLFKTTQLPLETKTNPGWLNTLWSLSITTQCRSYYRIIIKVVTNNSV